MSKRTSIGIAVWVALLAPSASGVSAQQTAVCSDTPGEGERIECTQDSTSTTDIGIYPRGIDIDATDPEGAGVAGLHAGTGDITIDVRFEVVEEDGEFTVVFSDITTTGDKASGVYGRHTGAGDITIVTELTGIVVTGQTANGIEAFIGHTDIEMDTLPLASGNIDIDVKAGSAISVEGRNGHGVFARHGGGEGRVEIDVVYSEEIATKGGFGANGIYVWRHGTATGPVNVTVTGVDIKTEGRSSHAVFVDHQGKDNADISIIVDGARVGEFRTAEYNGYGIRGWRNGGSDGVGTGTVDIDVRDLRIITTGPRGRGIDAYHTGTGDIDIDIEDGSIATSGELAYGIRARHQPVTFNTDEDNNRIYILQAGDITIDLNDLAITTRGVSAHGIEGYHQNAGDLVIRPQNVTIKTRSRGDYIYRGDNLGTVAHGIYGTHTGSGDIDIDIEGGSITTRGSYSYGIHGYHTGDGNISITTRDGHTIATTGDTAHAIVAYHSGTMDARTMAVTVGGQGQGPADR